MSTPTPEASGEPLNDDHRATLMRAANLPHSEPHYRSTCVRCPARAVLKWADVFPPFASLPAAQGGDVAALRQFVIEHATEARRLAGTRQEAARVWRGGTEADHRAGHKIAERMEGRRMPFAGAKEREKQAALEDRIAAKYLAEADTYDAIAAALDARLSPPQEMQEQGWQACPTCGFDRESSARVPPPQGAPEASVEARLVGRLQRARQVFADMAVPHYSMVEEREVVEARSALDEAIAALQRARETGAAR